MGPIMPTHPPKRKQRRGFVLPSTSSSHSLDMVDVLMAHPCENLLTTSLSSLSTMDSLQSLDNAPPFPSHAAPRVFVNITTVPTLVFRSSDEPTAMLSVPTPPRLKTMLLEPIYIPKWAEVLPTCLTPACDPIIEEDFEEDIVAFPAPPWIALGSIFAREAFHAIFRSRSAWHASLTRNSSETSLSLSISDSLELRASLSARQLNQNDLVSDVFSGNERSLEQDGDRPHLVPTIMVSNSTAVLPISLESSQSLTRLVPLAVRRGQSLPTPLAIGKIKLSNVESDPYPGIPSAFLGSPSRYSPTFEAPTESPSFSMSLETMCIDLRSRCPELRTPILPMAAGFSEDYVQTTPSSRVSSGTEDHEWDFTKDLDAHGRCPSIPDGRLSPVPRPINAPSDAVPPSDYSTTTDVDSVSWASNPTFIDSVVHGEEVQQREAGDAKMQRRRTVIIETENHNSAPSDPNAVPHSDDFDRPVPFEVLAGPYFSPTQCYQSTSPRSRPSSSATMRPVRGILKEKKTVRFSIAPSLHKYPSDGIREQPEAPPHITSEPVRRSLAGTHQASPLRQSFAPDGRTVPEDVPVEQTELSLPKHPALRPAAQPAPKPAAVDQKRPPLRILNGRQSLPVARSPQASPAARKNVAKSEVGTPKRLMKAASASLPARPAEGSTVVQVTQPGGSARRNSSPQKSRMPVPFRSILTKFRA
ncbi:hypothetical protein OBBRIDRAFT_822288 [Obba rivulosa]|uniref:Uncharacterized protein n=1 Tax=Obba rivulosa TaxID=1052685 RepID=A0A8E2J6X2_9APHY|nr:hypothetical protein OBBRIDRAFT_822288 [Obba rivulosa]